MKYVSCIWFSSGDLISCSIQTDLLSKTSYCWASFVNSWWASASEVCWNMSAGLSYNVSALWNIPQCIICIPVYEPKDFMIRKTYLKELNCTWCLLYLIFQFSSKSFFIALVTQIFRSDILPNTCSYLNNQVKHYPIVIQNNNSSIWIHILLN